MTTGVLRVRVGGAWVDVPALGPVGPQGPPGIQGPTGPTGPQGPGIISGYGAPDASVGLPGDWYLDQDTNTLYGAKQAQAAHNAFDTRSGNSTNTGVVATTTGNVLSFAFAGQITHLWHERSASSPNATHTLRLWDNKSKTLLATVATAGESGGGKVSVALPTPYNVKAGDVLMVTCDYPNGDANIFRNGTPVDSDDTLMRWGGSFYSATVGAFPDTANPATTNFFQDVTFVNAYWSPALANEFYVGPSAPTIDTVELWYDTDEPTVSEVLSQSLPLGFVGQASPSSDQAGIGAAMTDITGMAVAWNANPARRYKTTAVLTVYPSAGPASVVAQIANAAGALIRRGFITISTANYYGQLYLTAVESGLSGAQIRKVQANTSAGTLTVYSATTAALILVEDIGSA